MRVVSVDFLMFAVAVWRLPFARLWNLASPPVDVWFVFYFAVVVVALSVCWRSQFRDVMAEVLLVLLVLCAVVIVGAPHFFRLHRFIVFTAASFGLSFQGRSVVRFEAVLANFTT